jgi:hypothetical protein
MSLAESCLNTSALLLYMSRHSGIMRGRSLANPERGLVLRELRSYFSMAPRQRLILRELQFEIAEPGRAIACKRKSHTNADCP